MKNTHIRTLINEKRSSLIEEITLGLIASIVLALCAKLRFYLPIFPVPFVMQNTLLLFFAARLGRKGAVAMVLSFLGQGAIGLPIFSGGAVGLAGFLGPTGGYLVGYAVAAYVVAALQEKRMAYTSKGIFFDMAVGGFVIYLFGALYLATFVGSLSKAILLGVVPFILTDLLKAAILTTLASLMVRFHSPTQ